MNVSSSASFENTILGTLFATNNVNLSLISVLNYLKIPFFKIKYYGAIQIPDKKPFQVRPHCKDLVKRKWNLELSF